MKTILLSIVSMVVNAARIHRIEPPHPTNSGGCGYVILIDDAMAIRLVPDEYAQLIRTLNRLHDRNELTFI
jgi:hypothetical protein